MAELPRGVPYIDLLAPPGTAGKVDEIQTRIDLVGAAGWLVRSDDGTMEQSVAPLQPLRGTADRIQVYRPQPLAPGEPLAVPAQLAVELALHTRAYLAALGVYGIYSWGLVAMEDMRWLHGLLLLDWIYNPRIDERGELIESDDPAVADRAAAKKLVSFGELWTTERSAAFARKLPEGAVQTVESHQVLMMLGPGGMFDPRFWQSFSLQIGLEEIREWAQGNEATPDRGQGMGSSAPPVPAPPEAAALVDEALAKVEDETPPDDGLTPLARARLAAERRAEEAAANPEAAAPEPEEPTEGGGQPVSWLDTTSGPMLLVPEDRLDTVWLRDVRRGSTAGLTRSERPGGELLEGWIDAGAHFVTEVSSLARLLFDNLPLHRATWDAAAAQQDGHATLVCQLPRVARVLGVELHPAEGRSCRILVSSDIEISVGELVEKAG